MNTYTRSLILAAMAVISLSQGCSCSDSKGSGGQVVIDPPVNPDPDPVVVTIGGMAAKGLIYGGVVNVHPIVNGVLSDTSLASSITTDNGSYSVTIPDYVGTPFVVRVTAADDGSTTMRCDLAGGCGGEVAFGGLVQLNDPDFNIDAIVPPVSDPSVTASINLSVLSDTATSVALNTLSRGSDVTLEAAIAAISNANSSIANRFGIQGDLTALPIVDLTNPSAVAAASNNVLNFNLMSASIVEALMGGDGTQSITSAVQSFASQFVTNGGLADTESSAQTTVTLAEILAQASNVIDAIQAADTSGLTTNLATLETIIDTNQNLAQQGSTAPDAGTASPNTGISALDKARAMVAVLGDLESSIDMTVLAEGITLGAKADEFEGQVNAVELASSDGVEQVIKATAKVVEAFGAAYEAYDDNPLLTSWTSSDGIVVSITETMSTPVEGEQAKVESVKLKVGAMVDGASMPAAVTVDINGVITDVMVYMTAMEKVDTSEAMTDGNESNSVMGDLMIWGTAETADITLTVKEGSGVSLAEGMSVYSETQTGEQTDIAISGLTLDFMVMLAQKPSATITDPMTFEGALNVTLESLEASEIIEWTANGEQGTATQEISVLALSLSGSIMNSAQDKARVVFMIEGDGTGLDFSQNWLGDFDNRDNSEPEADNFAAASVSLAFEADMAGIDNALKLMYVMTRTSDAAADMALKLWYSDINLSLTTTAYDDDAIDQKATLTNQDGVVMTVTDTDEGMVGVMFVGTEKVADIKGAVVTYSDGTLASLDLFE